MAAVNSADLDTLFIVLAFLSFALAVWRATIPDVVGAILLACIGVVLLIVA